jgi:hypothetical protein
MSERDNDDKRLKFKLERIWESTKEDRTYAARIAKRDEAIAFAKYRKLREERGSDKN